MKGLKVEVRVYSSNQPLMEEEDTITNSTKRKKKM